MIKVQCCTLIREARQCRACKLAHDPRIPCSRAARLAAVAARGVVANTLPVVANRPSEPDVVANTMVANTSSLAAVVANSRHGKHADMARRRTYMREYMRKRRAVARLSMALT